MSDPITYVLSTRPLPDTLIHEAEAKGVAIDVVPLIGTKLLQDEACRIDLLLEQRLTAVFTSANAVAALANGDSGGGGDDHPNRPEWRIFCTNGATRRAVADRLGDEVIAGVAGSAKELAEVIIRLQATPRELWFFCGDRRREELPERLAAAGWKVHEVVVYQTVLTPVKIGRAYDAIAFFSPSAVESFFSMNTIGPDTRLFAIGPTTAAAIRQQCGNTVIVSEQPDEQILIRQIIKSIDDQSQK